MKLMRYKSEVMVAGTNAQFRRLLNADIKQAALPRSREPEQLPVSTTKVREGCPPPSLIEVAYSSHIKPTTFIFGVGMPIPPRLETWLADEPREAS